MVCAPCQIIRMIKFRSMKWVGHVPYRREKRNAYMVLLGEPEGQRPLVNGRNSWESNITVDFNKIGPHLCG